MCFFYIDVRYIPAEMDTPVLTARDGEGRRRAEDDIASGPCR